MSPESDGGQDPKAQPGKEATLTKSTGESWQRPEGLVNVVAVVGEGEKVTYEKYYFALYRCALVCVCNRLMCTNTCAC